MSAFDPNKISHWLISVVLGQYFLDTKKRIVVNAKILNWINKQLKFFGFKEIIDFEPQKIFSKVLKSLKKASHNPVLGKYLFYLGLLPIIAFLIFVWWVLETIPLKQAKDEQGKPIFITEVIEAREEFLVFDAVTYTMLTTSNIFSKEVMDEDEAYEKSFKRITSVQLKQTVKHINERNRHLIQADMYKYRRSITEFRDWVLLMRTETEITYPKMLTVLPPILHQLMYLYKSLVGWLWKDGEDMSEVFEKFGWLQFADDVQNLESRSWLFQITSKALAGLFIPFFKLKELLDRLDENAYFNQVDKLADSVDVDAINWYIGEVPPPTPDIPDTHVFEDGEDGFVDEDLETLIEEHTRVDEPVEPEPVEPEPTTTPSIPDIDLEK